MHKRENTAPERLFKRLWHILRWMLAQYNPRFPCEELQLQRCALLPVELARAVNVYIETTAPFQLAKDPAKARRLETDTQPHHPRRLRSPGRPAPHFAAQGPRRVEPTGGAGRNRKLEKPVFAFTRRARSFRRQAFIPTCMKLDVVKYRTPRPPPKRRLAGHLADSCGGQAELPQAEHPVELNPGRSR